MRVAAFSTSTFNKTFRPRGCSCAEKEKKRNLGLNEAVEGFGIIYLKSVEDYVKILNVHSVLILFQLVKLQTWYPLPHLLVHYFAKKKLVWWKYTLWISIRISSSILWRAKSIQY